MGKFYNIDPETCSKEELENAIKACIRAEEIGNTQQLGAKTFINSCYGALASAFYQCSNTQIAESITLQGQDLIKYSTRMVNEYFKEKWSSDIDVHNKIAKHMKSLHKDFNVENFLENAKTHLEIGDTLQRYGDTDSSYITMQPIIDQCKIPLEYETDFVLALNEFILDSYLDEKFNEYAKMFNCHKNLEKFELEKIARTLIMLAKKKYIMDISWKEPDVHVPELHSLVFKGIEIIQGSTPAFCRELMKEFITFMLEKLNKGDKPSYDSIISKLKDMKNRFAMQSPNEISKSFGMNDYEKYILDDKKDIVFTDAVTPMHVRAAAIYNNTLFTRAKRYKSKYNIIKKGDKVKFYYTDKEGLEDVFAFLPNEFPIEFAPKMNIDKQFEKMVLEPMNRIIVACGYPSVSGSLMFSASLW